MAVLTSGEYANVISILAVFVYFLKLYSYPVVLCSCCLLCLPGHVYVAHSIWVAILEHMSVNAVCQFKILFDVS